MTATRPRQAAALCLLGAGLALGIALGLERWGGLVPCALCLVERWPYRIAIGLAVAALLLPARLGRAAVAAAVLALLAGTALGAVHVGVENGLWPSPLPECAAPRFVTGSIAQRLAAMPAHPAKPCDDPVYPLPALPVSMATMNLLFSLALGAAVATLVWQDSRSGR